MDLHLKPVSPLDGKAEWEFLTQIPADEDGFTNTFHGKSYDEFPAWVLENISMSNDMDLDPEIVPMQTYWIYEEDRLVGLGKLRIRLNDSLLNYGGHIGYGIKKEERGRGYGQECLRLLIQKAKEKGIDQVLVTCNLDNIASQKVIEKNGGILEKKNKQSCFYWIYT